MNRLTYKNEKPVKMFSIDTTECEYLPKAETEESDMLNKLGKLEELEERFGIDLITLFKAFTCGFWFKYSGNGLTTYDRYEFVSSDTDKDHLNLMSIWFDKKTKKFDILLDLKGGRASLRDYGKKWALTKEELEHE